MIIECPKCRARFEVPESAFKFALQRFSCASCSFVFTAARPRPFITNIADDDAPVTKPISTLQKANEELPDARQLLRSLGMGESTKNRVPEIFTSRNLMFSLLGVAIVLVATFAAMYIPLSNTKPLPQTQPSNPPPSRSSVAASKRPAREQQKLYIEVVRNLTVIREGSNEFVPLNGYIFNPTNEPMPVPRLVVRIENRNGNLLQEQEHDPPVKFLSPGEKTDFEFKIFRFSDQMARFIVEFDESRRKP